MYLVKSHTKEMPFDLMYLHQLQGIEAINVRHSAETEQGNHLTEVPVKNNGDSYETGEGTVETQELVKKCVALEELVKNNIENAQKEQCTEYAKKVQKGVKTFSFCEGDLVLRLNTQKH